MHGLKRFLTEPFVHFMALGALLFLAYGEIAETPRPAADQTIDVSLARIDRLRQEFRAVWRRDPTDTELEGLVNNYVNEEVLYRTALAMGLDRDDPVIRQRLRYKVEFLADRGAELVDPGDDALQTYMDRRPEQYQVPPRVGFRQIYLGEQPDAAKIEATLDVAAQIGDVADLAELGTPTMLPPAMGPAAPHEVDRVFGQGFFDGVRSAPGGKWTGPISSGFGLHLVMVTETEPSRAPALEEVRDAVLRDWRATRVEELRKAQYDSLRSRFDVIFSEMPAQ